MVNSILCGLFLTFCTSACSCLLRTVVFEQIVIILVLPIVQARTLLNHNNQLLFIPDKLNLISYVIRAVDAPKQGYCQLINRNLSNKSTTAYFGYPRNILRCGRRWCTHRVSIYWIFPSIKTRRQFALSGCLDAPFKIFNTLRI